LAIAASVSPLQEVRIVGRMELRDHSQESDPRLSCSD
jgi:hypothetical protein